MFSDEKYQRFINRLLTRAQQLDQPITIGFRQQGIVNPYTGQKYLLTHLPLPLRGFVVSAEGSKPLEISTTCYVWRRYRGPSA